MTTARLYQDSQCISCITRGKDLISSLCSGILTIGPRFGGAINDAALLFKKARDNGQTPEKFVDEMKDKGITIAGIGHKIKSTTNPEIRVEILKRFVFSKFSKHTLLEYALEVVKNHYSKEKYFDIECRRLYRCLLCRSHGIMRSVFYGRSTTVS